MERERLVRSDGQSGDRLADAARLETVFEAVDTNEVPAAQRRADRLAEAADQLGAVFETVDLGSEAELARAVLDALKATDRAQQLVDER